MKKTPVIEKRIESQPSWIIRNANVELAVTKLGGHMAPVTFCRDIGQPVQPYHITPWQNEKLTGLAPVETPTRGDFFCLPFGANQEAFRGEKHPAHGETSGNHWDLVDCRRDGGATTLQIRIKTTARTGSVRRALIIVDGQNIVYSRTTVERFPGKAPFAHHAILRTDGDERTLLISTSKFEVGRTYPVPLANPAKGDYQYLAEDEGFRSLARVPSIYNGKPPCDCSAFPVRRGFCDLLQQFEQPEKRANGIPSWVAAVNIAEGWMWFALKDPALMPGRLFWIENHGRHGSPWNGRNSCLGIEDGRMYFDRGIAESNRPNPISRLGIPTAFPFPANREVEIRYVQGAVRVPHGFDRVAKVDFIPGGAVFHAGSGSKVTVPLNHEFLFNGRL